MDLRYVEIKRKSVDAIRGRVFQRDGWRCRYCGSAALPLHADHVYPVIAGGETTEDNMVTSCQRCNSTKSGKVGVWPKPIGYFDPPIPRRPSSSSMLLVVGGVALILA